MSYKIRHKVTGLYQTSGSWLGWSPNGKVWAKIGSLKNHLKLLTIYRAQVGEWELVEFEMVEKSVTPITDVWPK